MDDFLTKKECDRCRGYLSVRTTSWFTEETICLGCSKKEGLIKVALRQRGLGDMEGCGFVPTPDGSRRA